MLSAGDPTTATNSKPRFSCARVGVIGCEIVRQKGKYKGTARPSKGDTVYGLSQTSNEEMSFSPNYDCYKSAAHGPFLQIKIVLIHLASWLQ